MGRRRRMGLSIVDMMTGTVRGLRAAVRHHRRARDRGRARHRCQPVRLRAAEFQLSGDLVSQRRPQARPRAALQPSVADAEPALPHARRLYLHHVQQGEVLAGAVRDDRTPRSRQPIRTSAPSRNRLANREKLTDLLDEALSRRTTAEWLEHFAGRVPAAPVNDVASAPGQSVRARGRAHLETSIIRSARFQMVAAPYVCPGETLPREPAPALGQDTERLLAECGLSREHVAALRRRGVI